TDQDYAAKHDRYLNTNDVSDEAAAFLNLITRSKANQQSDAKALEELFISILGLQKSERVTLSELKHRLECISNQPSQQKSLDFYHLYAPVVTEYASYLQRHKLYDFADMLNLATDIVNQMPPSTLNYQYVLVDEAQDLSTAKYLLLKAILAKCRKVKLFAVGDDWQSIYRFAGSNLKVLDDFEQIFERPTYRGLIELTYRFGQPTAKISNKFIQKNPHQSRKQVKPHVNRQTPIEIKLNLHKQPRETPQDYEAVNQILIQLHQRYGPKLITKKIQIISRYNRDIYRLVREETGKYKYAKLTQLSESGMEFEWQFPDIKLKIPFCSMHKAKGITRDIIIVINANSGSHGIPAARGNDPVAETLLTKLDDYPHAEERRLWYVAITRAKEKTIIISDATRISPFVFEISPKLAGANVRVCPKCHRGIMQEKRRRDGKIYYSCSNFTGGCHHTEI
ncbi:MAG: UvrD-helicase domain-containing protein, partial [Candidatus Saccharibacteria bacterium]|nr:UvrD-helicase domain-containing protein [Candidatus Saccharibacteria bacterium]